MEAYIRAVISIEVAALFEPTLCQFKNNSLVRLTHKLFNNRDKRSIG